MTKLTAFQYIRPYTGKSENIPKFLATLMTSTFPKVIVKVVGQ